MKKQCVSTMIAGLAALAIAGSASAQTITIRITGSTAFRKPTHIAIGNILNPGYTFGYAGSDVTKAGQAEFRGTTIVGSIPVDIKTSWSGSVGGMQTLVQNLNVATFLNSTNLTTGGASGLTGPYDAATTADIAMSDSFQGSTAYTSPSLNDKVVGVIPFQWVRNVGSPAAFSNVSTLLAQILLGTGQIPLSQATGLNADEATLLTVIGRDEDSGTRLVAFAESGFGIFNPPFQNQVQGTLGAAGSVTGVAPWPINTVNGTTYPVGHSGYNSGGTVASALGTPGSLAGAGTWLVSYPGISDAATAVGLGAATLTYNGVAYSSTAVQEGQYTFWAYEHLMYRSSFAGSGKTVADQLATRIHDVDASQGGVLLSTMQVGRTVEGGAVTFGNPY